ncbi:hypothetical protein MHU86_3218 [Fragilaria crotonensis]|nr:hypothetical protein MHU86_3218 [Fragilaria crotonensis]
MDGQHINAKSEEMTTLHNRSTFDQARSARRVAMQSRTSFIISFMVILLHFHGCHAFSTYQLSARSRSALHLSTSTAVTEIKLESPPMQVFIEDTDAYGVVYNTNYVRAYERALHWFGESSPVASELLRKQDWSTVKVEKQRFKKSHALGGDFVVTGTRKSQSPTLEVWELEMANQETGTVYNSAVITIGTELPSPPPLNYDEALSPMAGNFLLYRDEFDINLHGRLPLRNVMNPFERSRSNSLGGPDALRKLQEEDGLIIVVTSVDEAALIHNDAVRCRPGSTVTVTTIFQVKRRGMIRCLHTMWADDDSGVPHRVAQAVVVLMILDAASRKPTSAIPDWLKEKLTLMGSGDLR